MPTWRADAPVKLDEAREASTPTLCSSDFGIPYTHLRHEALIHSSGVTGRLVNGPDSGPGVTPRAPITSPALAIPHERLEVGWLDVPRYAVGDLTGATAVHCADIAVPWSALVRPRLA